MTEPWTGGPIMDRPGKPYQAPPGESYSIVAFSPRDPSALKLLPASIVVTHARTCEDLEAAVAADPKRPIVFEDTGNGEHYHIGGEFKRQGYFTILCGNSHHPGAARFDFTRHIKTPTELFEILRDIKRRV